MWRANRNHTDCRNVNAIKFISTAFVLVAKEFRHLFANFWVLKSWNLLSASPSFPLSALHSSSTSENGDEWQIPITTLQLSYKLKNSNTIQNAPWIEHRLDLCELHLQKWNFGITFGYKTTCGESSPSIDGLDGLAGCAEPLCLQFKVLFLIILPSLWEFVNKKQRMESFMQ